MKGGRCTEAIRGTAPRPGRRRHCRRRSCRGGAFRAVARGSGPALRRTARRLTSCTWARSPRSPSMEASVVRAPLQLSVCDGTQVLAFRRPPPCGVRPYQRPVWVSISCPAAVGCLGDRWRLDRRRQVRAGCAPLRRTGRLVRPQPRQPGLVPVGRSPSRRGRTRARARGALGRHGQLRRRASRAGSRLSSSAIPASNPGDLRSDAALQPSPHLSGEVLLTRHEICVIVTLTASALHTVQRI